MYKELIINKLQKLSTISYQLSVINYQLSTISYQLSTINYFNYPTYSSQFQLTTHPTYKS
jgi:cobalt-precorrin-5B (C1)-methyltransferase